MTVWEILRCYDRNREKKPSFAFSLRLGYVYSQRAAITHHAYQINKTKQYWLMTYILRQEACGNGVRTHTQGLKDKDNLSPAVLPALDLSILKLYHL